jgi:hypothetical protein
LDVVRISSEEVVQAGGVDAGFEICGEANFWGLLMNVGMIRRVGGSGAII